VAESDAEVAGRQVEEEAGAIIYLGFKLEEQLLDNGLVLDDFNGELCHCFLVWLVQEMAFGLGIVNKVTAL
jgi:hypothetical protein